MSQARDEAITSLRREAAVDVPHRNGPYFVWLENRVLEARALAKTCYDHSVLAADSSEVAIDAQAKFEKWGMR